MRVTLKYKPTTLERCHDERNGVSNHQSHDCLFDALFRRRSKKTSKLRGTGLCEGSSPVIGKLSAQKPSNAEYVAIWWCHYGKYYTFCILFIAYSTFHVTGGRCSWFAIPLTATTEGGIGVTCRFWITPNNLTRLIFYYHLWLQKYRIAIVYFCLQNYMHNDCPASGCYWLLTEESVFLWRNILRPLPRMETIKLAWNTSTSRYYNRMGKSKCTAAVST